jgi:hypothetical protein
MFPAPRSVTLTMTGANQRKGVVMVERLRKPGMLLVVAVVCLASAVGNGLYDEDFSNVATIVFSVLGSVFLTAAIVRAALSHSNRPPRTERAPGRDKAERARRLQEELRRGEGPNLMGNMGGGSGPGTG